MITSLRLINFKPFENQFLEFRPLTLLSGVNSTGKSSVLQSLLLLRQSYQKELLPAIGLALNGDLVCIGTAQDAFCERAKEDYIGIEISWKDSKKSLWKFQYDPEKKDAVILNIAGNLDNFDEAKISLFNEKFHYLQAERIGPRTVNQIPKYEVTQIGFGQIGSKGEYTAHFLAVNENKPIPNSQLSHPEVKIAQRQYGDPETKSQALKDQVEAWMKEVSPGTRININLMPDMDLISLRYFYGDSNLYRATNVGFGITYTLPIIVAILASEPDTLILLENPEAHLHPKGQSKMGELLAMAASCGVQVVIETHSDHVLNGIRRAVKAGKVVAFR
jgi:predicted ATPase